MMGRMIGLMVALALPAAGQINARMLQYPDVSETQIAFVYAGDIWVAPKAGGTANRLSSPRGEESFPKFSPDGSLIAFTGNYDGNQDIYVVPAAGGVPTRLTHHPAADRVVDWFPDGRRILYATGMTSGKDRFNQFYSIGKDGGLPEKLPPPYGEFGSISEKNVLAYTPITLDFRTWKRYRGGMTPDIWLFNLNDLTAERLTDHPANDTLPMWRGDKLYFLSDRDDAMRNNLWVREDGKFRQVTFFKDYDIHFPSIGPSDIVFENGGRLYLYNLATETQIEVKVDVVTDQATLKPRAENVSKLIQSMDISPAGKRMVFEARGELFSVPAEHGPVLHLTRSPGAAERWPAWSPDGKHLAYFTDRGGEYALAIRAADGKGEEQVLLDPGPGFRYRPYWSPDSKKIVFIDQTMTIHVHYVETKSTSVVDKDLWLYHGQLAGFEPSWSADGRWLAYDRGLENRQRAVFLYDTEKGERHQVTSGFYDDWRPRFDPEGKYLYLLTGRSFEPIYSDLDNSWIYANTTQIAAITLRNDVASPIAPRNDEEKPKEEKKTDNKPEEKTEDEKEEDTGEEAKKEETPKPVEIDTADMERRLVILPPKAGRYDDLAAVKGKVIFRRLPRTGSDAKESPVVFYDLEQREEKTIVADANDVVVSADGNKLGVRKDGSFYIVDVKPDQKLEKRLNTDSLESMVDPTAEWRQIFMDAWRIQRDYFYDKGMHGVDWAAMRERYGALLDDAVTRWDVNFIIGELISELNASHTYRSGGDLETPPNRQVGLLGADFVLHEGKYRIAKIIEGAAWDTEVRSPLREPGVNVKEGDYLLAVNGVPIDTAQGPWAAFEGLANQTVMLTVNDRPDWEGARDVLVKTLSSEYRLRNLAWIEDMRKRVDEATGGRVGYIYVPDTGQNGQTELVRMFMAQFYKEGLIIDERFNSGGQIPDRFVELLNRPLLSYWGVRDGQDWQWPPAAHHGPKVMLVNGWSGSGGDCFPFYFREAGQGPLIGTRTWGGLIGITGAPTLIDGGSVTAPTFGIYSTDGEWIIESHGVEPDIEVIDDPAAMARGGDPQLERAIEEVMKALEKNPPVRPKKPAYPNRS